MRSYFIRTPTWVQKMYPNFHFQQSNEQEVIYLTFDDGPTPGPTSFVLDLLKDYGAKATFFCVGKQVQANREILLKAEQQGHAIGNHTHSHLNGWKTKNELYLRDVSQFDSLYKTKLFRPPYGKLKRSQARLLQERQIIMWSHMSGDFDPVLNLNRSLRSLLNAQNGSIMVFHDSEQAFDHMKVLLPQVLEHFSLKGYQFHSLKKLCS